MDNLTHSLIGAVMGQAGLKKKTGLAMPALIIGANLPDVDAACFFWLEGSEHLGFRRGITHGPPAMVILPLVLAGVLWWFDRWQAKRGKRPEGRLPVHFGWLYALSFIGCLSHPLFDWFNVYGVRLLEPFSSQWFYGDTLFIIDVWLWGLLAVTTWLSLRSEKRGGKWMRPAWIGGLIGLAYIALNGLITQAAVTRDSDVIAPGRQVIASPMPLFFWEREMIIGGNGRYGIVNPAIERLDYEDVTPEISARYVQIVGECEVPDVSYQLPAWKSELGAFLFWTRTPFATRREEGGIILHDARFYDRRARDRFSVILPDVECVELPRE